MNEEPKESLTGYEIIVSVFKEWWDKMDDSVVLVRCKDCKHRPKRLEEGEGEGFNLEFPDYKCPCQCDDGWYNWMPDDNWFCRDGERKEGGGKRHET